MKIKRCITVIITIMFALSFLNASVFGGSFDSGNEFLGCMKAYENFEKKGKLNLREQLDAISYVVYIRGVADTANGTCFLSPKGVTNLQMLSVVTKYLKTHPEELHKRPVVLILFALTEAFPLKK